MLTKTKALDQDEAPTANGPELRRCSKVVSAFGPVPTQSKLARARQTGGPGGSKVTHPCPARAAPRPHVSPARTPRPSCVRAAAGDPPCMFAGPAAHPPTHTAEPRHARHSIALTTHHRGSRPRPCVGCPPQLLHGHPGPGARHDGAPGSQLNRTFTRGTGAQQEASYREPHRTGARGDMGGPRPCAGLVALCAAVLLARAAVTHAAPPPPPPPPPPSPKLKCAKLADEFHITVAVDGSLSDCNAAAVSLNKVLKACNSGTGTGTGKDLVCASQGPTVFMRASASAHGALLSEALKLVVSKYTRGTATSAVTFHSSNMFYTTTPGACEETTAVIEAAHLSFLDTTFGQPPPPLPP